MITPETPREALELAVVGTALAKPDHFERLAAIIEPDTIRHPRTKALWAALANRIPNREPVDYAALSTDAELVKAVGGFVAFSQIAEHTVANAEWHAEQLRDLVAQQRTDAEIRYAMEVRRRPGSRACRNS